MKIALVNAKGARDYELVVPHGLLQLCAQMKHEGHICDIFDLNNGMTSFGIDEIEQYDVIGLSVMTTQLRQAEEIAERINDDKKVVWGGVHCLLDPVSIIEKFPGHFVVSGDGEIPLTVLMRHFKGEIPLDQLHGQKGISFNDNGRIIVNPPYFLDDIDALEDIDYNDLPYLEHYLDQGNAYIADAGPVRCLSILTSRGCSWNCSFCINSIYRKHKACHRSKTIEKIRRETEQVIDRYGIKLVVPMDEDFFSNNDLVREWIKYSGEKNFLWGANCRYNYFRENRITSQMLSEMVKSGLIYLGMSIETGSEELRNSLINKYVKNTDIIAAVEAISNDPDVHDALAVNTSFIIDFPGDCEKNRIDTIKWMDYLANNINIIFSGPQVYRAYPGSDLYSRYEQQSDRSFDWYTANITDDGSFKQKDKDDHELVFYSVLLRTYYNSRFKSYSITHKDGRVHVSYYKRFSFKKAVKRMFLGMVFLTITLRLKSGYWRCFFEPGLIGSIYVGLQRFLNRKV